MYPMLRDGVSLCIKSWKDDPEKWYIVTNDLGMEFRISPRLYRMLKHADGTHPLKVSRQKREALEKGRIITTHRFVLCGAINRFILFPVGRRASAIRVPCRVIHAILTRVALPLCLIASVCMALLGPRADLSGFRAAAYCALLVFSLAVHEAGHLFSGIALGYPVTDVGLLLLGFMPFGAYVAYKERASAPVRTKVQMALAGIKANLFMAGVLLILGMCRAPWAATFIMAAIVNIVLALVNALPVDGLDGGTALSHVLGVQSLSGTALDILLSAANRREMYAEGLAGRLCLAICLGVLLAKIALILLVACDALWIARLLFAGVGRFV